MNRVWTEYSVYHFLKHVSISDIYNSIKEISTNYENTHLARWFMYIIYKLYWIIGLPMLMHSKTCDEIVMCQGNKEKSM